MVLSLELFDTAPYVLMQNWMVSWMVGSPGDPVLRAPAVLIKGMRGGVFFPL